MKKRARRIMDKLRMKAKARSISKRVGNDRFVINADHLKVCSCWMCGNPRKFRNEKTLAELRAE